MKSYRTLIRLISLLFVAIFLSSCATDTAFVKPSDLELVTDADYLAYINMRLAGLDTFQGTGDFKISNSKKSDSATSAIMIKRPDSMRLESFSVFGQAVFFFAANNNKFSIFVPKDNEYFVGSNTVKNIKKVLPLDVPVEEFSNYLIGNFMQDKDDKITIKYLEDKEYYKIYFEGEEESRVLWFDPEKLTVTRCAVYDSYDEIKTIVTYSDFKEVNGIKFPMSIMIKFSNIDAKIKVNYDEIVINDNLKDNMFTLDVPKDSLVIDLDQGKVL